MLRKVDRYYVARTCKARDGNTRGDYRKMEGKCGESLRKHRCTLFRVTSNLPRVELNYVRERSARTIRTNARRNRTSVSQIFSIQPSRASFNGVQIQRGNFPKQYTSIWNLNAREFVGFAKNPYETSTKKNEESSGERDGEKKRERWKKSE